MSSPNHTLGTTFTLMGLTDDPVLEKVLFGVFLVVYLLTLAGNLCMIALISTSPHLHTPMYFFLGHLSFVDICYSSNITPNMLHDFLSEDKTISYAGCFTQCLLFIALVITEFYLLASMAYDRYVAICNPLLYTVIMSKRVCWVLVVTPYLYSASLSLVTTIKIFISSFCGNNIISHFYCDSLPLLTLICSNTQEIELIKLIFSAFNLVSSVLIVLISYILILLAILRMNSAEGRSKAFSTCGSHLTVVVVLYGTLFFMYVQPKSSHSFDTDKMASLFYTLVIPMLNPMIYSLRNKEVKGAIQRIWKNLCKISI
uniref:olfactory receptor 8K3-like n=1 Tax=Ictidomys tridecemlineatus TaxID=43179 RepID=UPI001AA0093C|nr:olfactory receptor 8K3-like [Ictidomys tridecemlineatus]